MFVLGFSLLINSFYANIVLARFRIKLKKISPGMWEIKKIYPRIESIRKENDETCKTWTSFFYSRLFLKFPDPLYYKDRKHERTRSEEIFWKITKILLIVSQLLEKFEWVAPMHLNILVLLLCVSNLFTFL